jgi:acyl-homoserine-lactone acylase
MRKADSCGQPRYAAEPVLARRDFVENSNDSYWMTNPAHPLTGFPRMIGDVGTGLMGTPGADLGLRTRSALAMVTGRIRGTDGLGPPGFTFADMRHLMYSDIQYGATLVKKQLVAMCRSFPGGRAPTSPGHSIPVGDSCRVLAALTHPARRPGSIRLAQLAAYAGLLAAGQVWTGSPVSAY